jgi:hypothetical protein
MRRAFLFACGLLFGCPITATYGALAFYTSNGTFTSSLPPGVDEENILVAKDLTGITVSGLTNTTGVQFDIMGNETLKNTANGQATVKGLDDDFTSAMVFPHLAGTRFQALELECSQKTRILSVALPSRTSGISPAAQPPKPPSRRRTASSLA